MCGLGARGHAAECKSSRRSGGSRASLVVARFSSAPPHLRAVDSGRLPAPHKNLTTTPVEGYLGSRNDEERSEMRYVM